MKLTAKAASGKCAYCGKSLKTVNRADNPGALAQLKYCSDEHAKAARNQRYYAAHKPSIIQRIMRTRREKRSKQ